MKLAQTLGAFGADDLAVARITSGYEAHRLRTEDIVGVEKADVLEHVVACIHEAVAIKLTNRRSTKSLIDELLLAEGWVMEKDYAALSQFTLCHDQACKQASNARHQLTQYSSDCALWALNARYFDDLGERTHLFEHPLIAGARVALSDLGHEPDVTSAFGMKVILPSAADHLLWWALSQSLLSLHFSVPTLNGAQSWHVAEPDGLHLEARRWTKTLMGRSDQMDEESRSEERFFSAPFVFTAGEERTAQPALTEGTYIAYHRLG